MRRSVPLARAETLVALLFGAAAGLLPGPAAAAGPGIPTDGPDVTISALPSVGSYGLADGYRGYAVGTTSCNIGSKPVNWCDGSHGACEPGVSAGQYPVIAQGIYRVYGGRMTQIGMSWLKHGFVSTNSNEAACKVGTPSCISPPYGGTQLGLGCNDTYGSSLNGGRPLGMRSEVNPTSGDFQFPETQVASSGPYQQRIKILETDLMTDAPHFPGALYYVDAQYISDNDALAGNAFNNASYRQISVDQSTFAITMAASLVRERSAIHGWKAADATVSIHNVNIPGAIIERFEVARRVSDNGDGTWHYEYAIRNMNSDRAANGFTVEFAPGTAFSNVGFKDIEHHSGEPYATSDWDFAATQETGTVTWGTSSHADNPNANALRWATMFNFWFDAAAAPDAEIHTLGLFKPGSPTEASWRWPVFADGFEAHNLVAWSEMVLEP